MLVLETMVVGITGKKPLWRALAASDLPRKGNIDFVEMEQRAEEQIARVELERMRAAREALSRNPGQIGAHRTGPKNITWQ